jgi:hypothetical protein
MSHPKCIITGCALVVPNAGRHVHGDLHVVGNAMVFNAVVDEGAAAWEYGDTDAVIASSRRVVVVDSNLYFERRGVFAFDKTSASFNEAASDHMKL